MDAENTRLFVALESVDANDDVDSETESAVDQNTPECGAIDKTNTDDTEEAWDL